MGQVLNDGRLTCVFVLILGNKETRRQSRRRQDEACQRKFVDGFSKRENQVTSTKIVWNMLKRQK